MSTKEMTFEEIEKDLAEDDGAPAPGVVPTDCERFGKAIPTDTENAKHAANPFRHDDNDV
jgi:hypothetical protein